MKIYTLSLFCLFLFSLSCTAVSEELACPLSGSEASRLEYLKVTLTKIKQEQAKKLAAHQLKLLEAKATLEKTGKFPKTASKQFITELINSAVFIDSAKKYQEYLKYYDDELLLTLSTEKSDAAGFCDHLAKTIEFSNKADKENDFQYELMLSSLQLRLQLIEDSK